MSNKQIARQIELFSIALVSKSLSRSIIAAKRQNKSVKNLITSEKEFVNQEESGEEKL
jgi:hypothetical protein